MDEMIESPVPINQRPLEEFVELTNSYFFSWPKNGNLYFNKNLLLIWLITFPIFLLVASGSYSINKDIYLLSFMATLSSSIVPLMLIIRQFLGWNYVYRRLLSEIIAYEETDWHDGQIWKKPDTWKTRDKLIANEQVFPIINNIRNSLVVFVLFIILTSLMIILLYKNL